MTSDPYSCMMRYALLLLALSAAVLAAACISPAPSGNNTPSIFSESVEVTDEAVLFSLIPEDEAPRDYFVVYTLSLKMPEKTKSITRNVTYFNASHAHPIVIEHPVTLEESVSMTGKIFNSTGAILYNTSLLIRIS